MKFPLLLFILLLILLISGCNNIQKSTDIYIYSEDEVPPRVWLQENIVEIHGELKNKERFEQFFNNVQQRLTDRIRVVKYTTEGDPIFYEFEYDGEIIKKTIDTRMDQYGHGEIIETTCTSIKEVEMNDHMEYLLDGCEKDIDNLILVIPKI